MNVYIGIIVSLLSTVLGFVCGYLYFRLRKMGNKVYEHYYVEAQEALHNKQYDLSIKFFNKILNLAKSDNPIYLSSLVGISQGYIGIEDYEKAYEHLEKALGIADSLSNKIYRIQLSKLKTGFAQKNLT